MAVKQSQFTRSYNSLGGTDIKAVFAGRAVGTLQGISFSIARDKAPIFTMGSADARAFGRGKRHVAGSMVFIQFDMDPIMEILANPYDKSRQLMFLSDKDDLRATTDGSVLSSTVSAGSGSSNAPGASILDAEMDIAFVGDDQEVAVPWYVDQIPAFDIVLSGANEYGALAQMKIYGVEFLTSGYGISVDDIVGEHSHTFVATSISPWQSFGIHSGMGPK